MKILARVHLYPPKHCAGAERMLQALLEALAARGHAVAVHVAKARSSRQYKLGGVGVYEDGCTDGGDWHYRAGQADVLITHLDQTHETIHAAIARRKPLVQLLHNTHAPTRMYASCRNDLIVYNSHAMRVELGDDPNGIVVRPPVRSADYATTNAKRHLAGKVTLINLNQAKGGLLFAMLAATMPDTRFLGVLGAYGEQLIPDLPNVEIRPHGGDMLDVYRDTAVLLMPSSYESYGRVGVEAMASGIPVMAAGHPGVREALGSAGIFLQPEAALERWAWLLGRLLDDPGTYRGYSLRAYARAAELDPTEEIAAFCDRVEAL